MESGTARGKRQVEIFRCEQPALDRALDLSAASARIGGVEDAAPPAKELVEPLTGPRETLAIGGLVDPEDERRLFAREAQDVAEHVGDPQLPIE